MAFKKMEDSGVLPGPRAVFICGFAEESHQIMKQFLINQRLTDIDVIPCREDSLENTIETTLENKSNAKLIAAEKLPPVMLWSGITHPEFEQILNSFSKNGLSRPIFATTTIHNMSFSVKEFLKHMLEEQKSMREAQQQKS